MYKFFVFDIDGTLIDSNHVVISALSKIVFEELKIKKRNEELYFALGIPAFEVLQKLGIRHIEQAKARWDQYMQEESDSIVLFDGIKTMLDTLYEKGIDMGIVTSRTRYALNKLLAKFSLDKYFKNIVCKDDTHLYKPNPDPLLKYMQRSKANASSIIYIGDTYYDSLCALNANIDFGLALWDDNSISSIRANYIFKQPQDIPDLVALD